MKIAVPVHNGFVNDHFGHSDQYKVLSVSTDNKILHSEIVKANEGCGCHSGIAEVLASHGVTVMLAGNIGAGAIQHLYTNGIDVVRGCSGLVEDVVTEYLRGNIIDNNQTCHQHEGCDDKHKN
jgi:predicted Fe-Mo cluster-binding NifX family protein